MIPNIALMIGAYIGFRMLEVTAKPNSVYATTNAAIIVKILAILTFLVSGFACVSTLMGGANIQK
jgi:hypothetical protein